MENKQVDNKKLTKTYLYIGCGVLLAFIIIRLCFRASGINEAENPDLANVEYNEINLPKERTNQEKLRLEEKNKQELKGEAKNEYVFQDFNSIVKTSTKEVAAEKENKQTPAHENDNTLPSQDKIISENKFISENNTLKQKPVVQQGTGENNISKERSKKIESIETENEPQQQNNTNTSVFGTVRREDVNNNNKSTASHFEGIKAQAYGDQKLTNGNGVIIRNKEKIVTIDGLIIPPNSLLSGKVNFSGNRIEVILNKVQMPTGTYNIDMYVLDNDNIEGIYYKAPLDEVKEGQVDQSNTQVRAFSSVPWVGGLANSVSTGILKGAKQLSQKSRSLDLTDGYIMYIIPRPKKKTN